jgi:hypothetical protein
MRAAARLITTLLAVVFAAACSADEDPLFVPTDENVVGTFALFLVNGDGLPFVAAANGTTRIQIISGHITLNADRTITDEVLFRVTRVDGAGDPEDVTETRTGTYVREGAVVFASFDGSETPTRIDVTNGPQLTRSLSGFVMSYRR